LFDNIIKGGKEGGLWEAHYRYQPTRQSIPHSIALDQGHWLPKRSATPTFSSEWLTAHIRLPKQRRI